jgi:hypothetical protein
MPAQLEIKGLTISQPYADLVASGEKWIENRVWPTTFRGPVAIHAGRGTQYLSLRELAAYPRGVIVGVARVAACVSIVEIAKQSAGPATRGELIPSTSRTWLEAAHHDHLEGPWCWVLEDVRRVHPIACRGYQRLWPLDNATLAALSEQLAQQGVLA